MHWEKPEDCVFVTGNDDGASERPQLVPVYLHRRHRRRRRATQLALTKKRCLSFHLNPMASRCC